MKYNRLILLFGFLSSISVIAQNDFYKYINQESAENRPSASYKPNNPNIPINAGTNLKNHNVLSKNIPDQKHLTDKARSEQSIQN